MPKINRLNTKNTLFARPTPAITVSPNVPIISVSTILVTVFKSACAATGAAIITVFRRKTGSKKTDVIFLFIFLFLREPFDPHKVYHLVLHLENQEAIASEHHIGPFLLRRDPIQP